MIKKLYSIIILFILFPINVLAEGYFNISPNSLTIEKGSSKTIAITAYNAIGDVYIKSNNNDIAAVGTKEWGTGIVDEKQTKKGTITITGKQIGTTTISVTIDAATFDGDDLSGQTKTITVNVVEKSTPPVIENNLSKNNNLKSLNIEGYELLKKDNNNYELTVTNDVQQINVDATAEDEKAKIVGTGNHELEIGENTIEVLITSESGLQNKITIKINRKDGFYLEDLDIVLKKDNEQDRDIIIFDNSIITKEQLNKIKESNKTIRLNYFNENKKLIYSWTINGKEIKKMNEFTPAFTFKPENIKDISKLTNYADGLYINFKHKGDFPYGSKAKIYVGDNFDDGDIVKLYSYNDLVKTLDFTNYELKVNNGYIEFNVDKNVLYFITMSNLGNLNQIKESSINIFLIFAIFEFLIIIILLIYIKIKLKIAKNEDIPYENLIPLENQFTNVYSNQNTGSNAMPSSDIYVNTQVNNNANSIHHYNE